MESFFAEAAFMATAAGKAFVILVDPTRLMFLAAGCIMGLVLGIIPGIGGLAGTAMLLPFTFDMDPYSAFALLLGLGSTVATGDPIPAVLFGVPGGAASAATVLDGFPMAKRGEAGRALSACYTSSMLGGLAGAALMAVTIPVLRPVMLYIGSPELLAFAVFGISMVAALSGNSPLRGLTAGCFGIMTAMIGSDPQTGTLRWTFDSLYLWDGLPLVPVVVGLFALPELCDLLIKRTAIAGKADSADIYKGQWQGARDCFRHWWLILRCSWIGGGVGSIPGVGGSVIDWLAYGHALRSEEGATQTFGRGDVRGVIASESSNNAKEGGALVPTVAFGVPGTAGMAILLGAFLIHGLVPGPDMLHKNLDVTYSMVWSVALANVLGAGMCYAFSPQFARLATMRYTLILPAVLGIIYIGSFEASRNWGDLYALLFFGVLGWTMKQFRWPRPPLLLGAVLGDIIERYMFISVGRYGPYEWMLPWNRWIVTLLLLMALSGLMRPFIQDIRTQAGLGNFAHQFRAPRFRPQQLFTIFMIVIIAILFYLTREWPFAARVVPTVVCTLALGVAAISLLNEMCRRPSTVRAEGMEEHAQHMIEETLHLEKRAAPEKKSAAPEKMHMDITSDTEDLPIRTVLGRGVLFFGYMIGFMTSMAVFGLLPTAAFFVVFFMRYEGQERWSLVIPYALGVVVFIYIAFDQFMAIPWPQTYLGDWVPALKGIIPTV